MSRTIGLLLAFVGGLAIATGVGFGATELVSSDQTIKEAVAAAEDGTAPPVFAPPMFIYGSR